MRDALALRQQLGARLMPLTALMAVLISLSAPVAFLVVRLRELHALAATHGHQLADLIRQEGQGVPTLWKYNALKIVEHLNATRPRPDFIERVVLVDGSGALLDLQGQERAGRERDRALLWDGAPIEIRGKRVGQVWVGVSPWLALKMTRGILYLFAALAILLALLIYHIPMKAMGRAEGRISALVSKLEEAQRSLACLNQSLEQQVAERSAQLQEAYQQLKGREKRLRELSSHAMALQEQERRAIARELHDSVGQELTAIRISLQLLSQRLVGQGEVQGLLSSTLALADEALEDIRRALRTLGPAILDDMGLASALERYAEDFTERTAMVVRREIDAEGAGRLTKGVESACYRIVQEAMSNVAKHSGAREVHLSFRISAEEVVVLEIRDNGRGFDPAQAVRGEGHGLSSMRERAELLGGVLLLEARPGEGVRLEVRLPVRLGAEV